jgi:high-affinity iron transporter
VPQKIALKVILALLFAGGIISPAFAEFETWSHIAEEMSQVLDKAYDIYTGGDPAKAKAQVDVAYFRYYEKLGFEKTVMAYISGARAAQVEYQFSAVKKAMTNKAPAPEIRASLDTLSSYLKEDAAQLDGESESPVGVFFASLIIILREGFEAILIVGAIAAWLIKSGNRKSVAPVYWGSAAALLLSIVMAWVLDKVIGGGQNQEIIEGVTMLTAVAVLFYVSNWMLSKSETQAWTGYIESKVQSSLSRGSVLSLGFTAFLAVFREGAETILFYQALLAQVSSSISMVWAGLGAGIILLVAVFIIIRVLSIRLPIKPFFLGTSILLFIMCVTFTGNGVKELQEGNLISVTPIGGIGSLDLLGIYPTLETLIPQALLLALTAALFVIQLRKGKKTKLKTGGAQ